jgi:hypothetical protein
MPTKALILLALLAPRAGAAETPSLEKELLRAGQEVIKHCEDKGYKNIGVLKFQVSKDGKPFSDNVGTLNVFLARRLEVALVLAQQNREKHPNPVGIIDNATAVAHRTKGANHLSGEGRLKLFGASYPLAWGKSQVRPDAFITGTAEISKDLKTLKVQLLIFDKTENILKSLGKKFAAANQPEQLVEMGESFTTRGLFDDGKLGDDKKKEAVLDEAARIKNQEREGGKAPPLNPADKDAQAPVKLKVLYDGNEVPITVKGGKAFVPEPRQNQRVVLVLERDKNRERYGIVLKVNGENTIEKQRLPDLQCRRWILEPSHRGPMAIDGYQINDKKKELFRVLSAAESHAREVDYGANVGTITLTVFRAWNKDKKKPPQDPSDEAKEAMAVHKGTLETKPQKDEPEKPDNLDALTARLLAEANSSTPPIRALVVPGQEEQGEVKVVEFDPDPLPIMTLTVIYYKPSNPPK